MTKALNDNEISIGHKYSLYSEILDEERTYWVHVPSFPWDVYHLPPKGYAVLYLLDGDEHFKATVGAIDHMARSLQIPRFMVVAIPNTDRNRDLTPTHSVTGHDGKEIEILQNSGGGDNFLSFIKNELMPKIDKDYETLPYQLLVGHSFGGLAVLHALLNHPDMFQSYISIDPSCWWDDQFLTRQAEQLQEESRTLKGSTYISLANNYIKEIDDPMLMQTTIRAFGTALQPFESSEFRFKLEHFPLEDHGSVPFLSLYHGLLYIFEGYKPDFEEALDQPTLLDAHYKTISERFGLDIKPPEAFVNGLGLGLLNFHKKIDKAFEALEMNAANYPESYNVYKSLAEAYEVKEDDELAIKNYQKAIDLNPDLQELKDKLESLRAGSS